MTLGKAPNRIMGCQSVARFAVFFSVNLAAPKPVHAINQMRATVRVLVACEFSGTVRDAFRERGHDAWSCDLLDTETPGQHIKGDVRDLLTPDWDLMIAHPPCTHLAVSGSRWFEEKRKEQSEALKFVFELLSAPIPKICVENPVSIISSHIRPPDQIIQPWQFGDGETKATCLWLKNLPPLQATHSEEPDLFLAAAPQERFARVHRLPPSPTRWMERSRTYTSIAEAMAEQWG